MWINGGRFLMYPDIIKSSQACIVYAQEKGQWPSQKEWNVYAYKYGYYNAATLSRLGIWDDLQALSALNNSKTAIATRPPSDKVGGFFCHLLLQIETNPCKEI